MSILLARKGSLGADRCTIQYSRTTKVRFAFLLLLMARLAFFLVSVHPHSFLLPFDNLCSIAQDKPATTMDSLLALPDEGFIDAKAKKLETINIIISIDATHLDGILPIMISTLKHTRHPIKFYLMASSTNKTEISEDWLREYIRGCATLHLDDELSQFQFVVVQTNHLQNHTVHNDGFERLSSAGNFARFYFPSLLSDLDYAVYLDTDTLILGDVAEIWNTLKFSTTTVVAVRRPIPLSSEINKKTEDIYKKRHGKHIDLDSYGFNAGIWAVNLHRWREMNYTTEAEWWMSKNDEEVLWSLGTQPVMLVLLYNDWVSLSSEWNLWGLGSHKPPAQKSLRSAKLLHWNGVSKPWVDKGKAHQYYLWNHYTCPRHRQAISTDDAVPGWAGKAIGGTDLERLQGGARFIGIHASQSLHFHLSKNEITSTPLTLVLDPGIYVGVFHIQSSFVTIVGNGPGVTIIGGIQLENVHFVTVRNIAIQSNESWKPVPPTISITGCSTHIWLDHLDVDLSDSEARHIDLANKANYLTVSWCIFRHTTRRKQNRASLIVEKRKAHVTFMNNFWGYGVELAVASGYGHVHIINNWFSGSRDIVQEGRGVDQFFQEWSSFLLWRLLRGWGKVTGSLIENCHIQNPVTAANFEPHFFLSPWGEFASKNNVGLKNNEIPNAIHIPYELDHIPIDELEARLLSPSCGAGNTCHLEHSPMNEHADVRES